MRQSRGFTLIELMIVVAIIAILASIAISVYMNATAKSQLSEAFTLVDGLKSDVSDYYDQTGSCPTLGAGGLSAATSYSGKYVSYVGITSSASGCSITSYMRTGTVSSSLQGKEVTFQMTNNGGAVSWQCSSDVSPVYLPATCQ